MLYRDGEGVKQSYKEAARWFLEASKQGEAGAQLMLGILYKFGEIVLSKIIKKQLNGFSRLQNKVMR